MRHACFTLLAACLVLAGCQGSASADGYPAGPVTMTAGASPGSGFDLTIRAVVDSLQKEGIVDVPLPVQNRPGGSGADFLATMVEQYRGADDQISVTSLSMMTNQLSGTSRYGYGDVTMIARLMTEYFMVVARPDAPFQNLGDLLAAVRSDPSRVAIGAALDDQAPFDLLVSAAGGDPSRVHYVTHEGGGDQSAALASGEVGVAIGGVSEFIGQVKTRDLKGLAVLAEDRLPGLDVPTAREQGFDVTLSNWRGLYGPPDMPAYAVDYWQQALAKMVDTATWRDTAERSQFTTTFMVGEEFQNFLAKTQADVQTALRAARG
ncbi:tripartite tricarboxylate transporter substrate binding protein [Mycobacterium yunnanensis]|uniref:Tripartite tricarboxylate transporter substrate binding protein n=1 Tax=Mycobacterium yunnanensis TaxID=368477 RepID=A0A9X2Z7V6_9MYCO|nr:tripartite tricarboxylate transporter substrate-binding protein [Mycobacterium yunnanensis]MCV7423886.1 tripartite tricarboxylate transporter substrate binding protein [Mycobacterium yunnanensis]